MTDKFLPEGLLWKDDGHVTDLVLSLLVDNEVLLLPAEATEHVDTCEACLHRLTEMASLSFRVEHAVRVAEEAARSAVAFPIRLFSAVLGAVVLLLLRPVGAHPKQLIEWPHHVFAVFRSLRTVSSAALTRLGPDLVLYVGALSMLAIALGAFIAARHTHAFVRESSS
jgi:hypothetical protein